MRLGIFASLAIIGLALACLTIGGDAAAFDNYAYCANDQGSDGNLVAACTMAIQGQRLNQPQWIQAHINRATHLIRLNRYPEAIRDLDVVTGLRPNDVQPFATRARLYHSLGRLQEAHYEYKECAKRTRDPQCKDEADVIGKALHPEKTDWELHISDVVWTYVYVNGRQVLGKESGNAKVDLDRYFKTGHNEIVIRQRSLGKSPGHRVEVRKDGKRALFVPQSVTALAFRMRYSDLMKFVIHRESAQCWIYRGSGMIRGSVADANNNSVDISGPEPCEHYRNIPSGIVMQGGGPPMMPGTSVIKYLAKIYRYSEKLERQRRARSR